MGRGKRLTQELKAIILALSRQLVLERQIASYITKSKTAVHNFMFSQINCIIKKKRGRPKPISNKLILSMHCDTPSGNYSAQQLREILNSPITVRRTHQQLNNPNLVCEMIRRGPKLSKHKNVRLQWSFKHDSWMLQYQKQAVFWIRSIFRKVGMDFDFTGTNWARNQRYVYSSNRVVNRSWLGLLLLKIYCLICLISKKADLIMYSELCGTEILRFSEKSAGDTILYHLVGYLFTEATRLWDVCTLTMRIWYVGQQSRHIWTQLKTFRPFLWQKGQTVEIEANEGW